MPAVFPEPGPGNGWLAAHAALLLRSYRHWTGRELLEPGRSPLEAAQALYEADFVVLSHDAEPDPRFTYANLAAQRRFEMCWSEIVTLPSRYSAEPMQRDARARFLERVARDGYVDDYSGMRIAKSGRRFLIRQALVWNLLDESGVTVGQAAAFKSSEDLP